MAAQRAAQAATQPPVAPFSANAARLPVAAAHPEPSKLLLSDEFDAKEPRKFEEKVDKMEDAYVDLAIADYDVPEPEPPAIDAVPVPAAGAKKKQRALHL
eukprot:Em0015g680a